MAIGATVRVYEGQIGTLGYVVPLESDTAAPGRVTLTILSGVDSFSESLTVNEEEPTVVRPRGINVRGGATWFVLESLPAHGTLYQYDATNSAGGFKGPQCQYSDDTTCSGNGTVDEAGACVCNPAFFGTDCSSACTPIDSCTDGSLICTSDSDSKCTQCDDGIAGPTCGDVCETYCNGKGKKIEGR